MSHKNVITGAYMEIYVETDIGLKSESETLVGETHDDVELDPDVTRAEQRQHMDKRSMRKPLFEDCDLNFTGGIELDAQALKDLGLLDDSVSPPKLNMFARSQAEAIRIDVYENIDDSATQQEWRIHEVELEFDGFTFPSEEFANYDVVALVGGDIEGLVLGGVAQ